MNTFDYIPRVNFLKYKKPEKHIDLEKSEVYKVIHELDHSPKRGIEFRPEKVVAEADVRSVSCQNDCHLLHDKINYFIFPVRDTCAMNPRVTHVKECWTCFI